MLLVAAITRGIAVNSVAWMLL